MGAFGNRGNRCSTNPQASAPNPARFRVLQEERIGRLWVAMLHYPNCTNFEGHKIVVCKGVAPSLRTTLDPHFTEGGDVVARFEPTPAGFALARTCAHAY